MIDRVDMVESGAGNLALIGIEDNKVVAYEEDERDVTLPGMYLMFVSEYTELEEEELEEADTIWDEWAIIATLEIDKLEIYNQKLGHKGGEVIYGPDFDFWG